MFVRPYTCAYVSIYVCVCHTVTSGYLCLKALRKVGERERERAKKLIVILASLLFLLFSGLEKKKKKVGKRGEEEEGEKR